MTYRTASGELGHAAVNKPDYETARAAALKLIPEGCQVIVIRKAE
ncbi:hypothetical protein ARZXY2_2527 [Arthrobacter sp. ZXY-2]|nr:hypothetical protein ARZXY2_2527 [Arthrobacter sp. ZXY-2]